MISILLQAFKRFNRNPHDRSVNGTTEIRR